MPSHITSRASPAVGATKAVFGVNKANRVTDNPLSSRDMQRILKSVAVQGRLAHANDVSGHSLRVGMTDAAVTSRAAT